jgi:hypothetical protein
MLPHVRRRCPLGDEQDQQALDNARNLYPGYPTTRLTDQPPRD